MAWCSSRAARSHLNDRDGSTAMKPDKSLSLRGIADTTRQVSAPIPQKREQLKQGAADCKAQGRHLKSPTTRFAPRKVRGSACLRIHNNFA
jgi:hypothetical protein